MVKFIWKNNVFSKFILSKSNGSQTFCFLDAVNPTLHTHRHVFFAENFSYRDLHNKNLDSYEKYINFDV
jgi:hypothetical protein